MKLTPEQVAEIRRRWEGSAQPGFQWLANEVAVAWNLKLTRVAIGHWAKRQRWAKKQADATPLDSTLVRPLKQSPQGAQFAWAAMPIIELTLTIRLKCPACPRCERAVAVGKAADSSRSASHP